MLGIPLDNIIGMVAGILIVIVGIFVLQAHRTSALHQLFFAFALSDGLTTFLRRLAASPGPEFFRVNEFLLYFYANIAFIGLLAAFGYAFPRPWGRRSSQRAVLYSIFGVTALVELVHGVQPGLFWTVTRDDATGGLSFGLAFGGRLMVAVFNVVVALILLRLAWEIRREPSPSHRRQGALVMSGLVLANVPYAMSVVKLGVSLGADASFFSPSPDVAIAYLSALAPLAAAIFTLAIAFRERGPEKVLERRIVIVCILAVFAASAAAAIVPSSIGSDLVSVAGFLAYPILLAYAIVRYEVLDIHAKLRRSATLATIGIALAAVFLVIEAAAQQILQNILSEDAGSSFVASFLAGIVTALFFLPISHLARRLVDSFAPFAREPDVDQRRLEIYRHTLLGVLQDGIIEPRETIILDRLRETLGVTLEEHMAMLRELGPNAIVVT